MSACRHVGMLDVDALEVYACNTRVAEGIGISACQHVGTLEAYKCKTRVAEGAGMSPCWHVGT